MVRCVQAYTCADVLLKPPLCCRENPNKPVVDAQFEGLKIKDERSCRWCASRRLATRVTHTARKTPCPSLVPRETRRRTSRTPAPTRRRRRRARLRRDERSAPSTTSEKASAKRPRRRSPRARSATASAPPPARPHYFSSRLLARARSRTAFEPRALNGTVAPLSARTTPPKNLRRP